MDLGAGTNSLNVSQFITGLAPGTVYEFQVVASNYHGTVFGSQVSFLFPSVPPVLTITPSGANVILAWPTNDGYFTLEFATNLAPLAVWQTNSPPPVVISGQNVVTNSIAGTQMFFRLMQ
jgi:hypothetical protein